MDTLITNQHFAPHVTESNNDVAIVSNIMAIADNLVLEMVDERFEISALTSLV